MEGLKKSFLVRGNNIVGFSDKNFSTCPIGTVLSFAGQTAPNGYLLCNGASYKVADYPDLYAVIGNTYGGDTENFNVPNLVDKFIQGSTTSGEEKEAGLPNITGTFYHDTNATSSLSGAFFSYTGGSSKNLQNDANSSRSGYISFDASKSNSIYGNSDTVQPPALTMVYIIKAFHTNEGVDSGISDVVINYINNNIKKVVQYENAIQLVNTDYIRTDDIGFVPILSRTGNIVTLSMRLWCKEVDTPTDIPFKVLDIPDGYKPIDKIYLTAPTNNINKTLSISYTYIDIDGVKVRAYNDSLNGMQLYFPIMTWITNDELPN